MEAPAISPAPTAPVEELATREAIRKILGAGLGAAGLGMLARGGQEMVNHYLNPRPIVSSAQGPTVVEMTTLPNRKKPLNWIVPGGTNLRFKQANDPVGTAANAVYDYGVKPLGLEPMMNFGTSVASKPWLGAGVVGATGAGALGGWKLVDWLSKRRRESDLNRELGTAEREYVDAIKALRGTKIAEATQEAIEKQANGPAPAPSGSWSQGLKNFAGGAGNLWGGTAALAALVAGPTAYNFVRNNTDRRALQEAIYLRNQQQQARSPANVILVPPQEEEVLA